MGGLITVLPLTGLAITGFVIIGWRKLSPQHWFLLWSIVLLTFGTSLFIVMGRIRSPIIPLLIIPTAFVLSHVLGNIRNRKLFIRLTIGLFLGFVISGGLEWAWRNLPDKNFGISTPLAETVPLSYQFSDELQLTGYHIEVLEHRGGSGVFFSLNWHTPVAPSDNYLANFILQDSNTGEVINSRTILIGTSGYPRIATSQWEANAHLSEYYFISFPRNSPSPLRLSLSVQDGLGEFIGGVDLFRVGIITEQSASTLETLTASESEHIRWGEYLITTSINVPESATSGDIISIEALWESEQSIHRDYVLFFHLVNEDQELVAQSDSVSLQGEWTTSALIPDYPLAGEREFEIPAEVPSGIYTLWMGLYAFPEITNLSPTTERPISTERVLVSEITVINNSSD